MFESERKKNRFDQTIDHDGVTYLIIVILKSLKRFKNDDFIKLLNFFVVVVCMYACIYINKIIIKREHFEVF